jgi:hypothetical protein
MDFDGATVLLQWAVGGLAFCWVTTRRRLLGIGYGWLLRGVWGTVALGALVVGLRTDTVPVREAATAAMILAVLVALAWSIRRRADGPTALPTWLDLPAPVLGLIGLVAAGVAAGGPDALAIARVVVGAAFLGSITDAMLLGHWYLVQPGLPRDPLLELLKIATVLWVPEIVVLLWPTGMVSVLNGTIDDGYGGMLGWFWVMSAVTTLALLIVTRLALREKQYSAVMAATGLLYLAILTAAGTDLVARALLAPEG